MKKLTESGLRALIRTISEAGVDPELYAPPRLQRVRGGRPGRRGGEDEPSGELDPLDNPDDDQFRAGGEWGIPGDMMGAAAFRKRFGKPALYNAEGGKVKKHETEKIAARTAQVQPDRIIAYSRGAAAYNQTVRDEPNMQKDIPVTFLAPSSYRKWSSAPVTKAPPGSVTIIGDDDKIVPFKQACDNANAAGTRMFVQPGYSHTGIMYSGGDIDQDAFEVDPKSCSADSEMPDWKSAPRGSPEQHEKQQELIKTHLKHEAAIRSLVRGMLREKA